MASHINRPITSFSTGTGTVTGERTTKSGRVMLTVNLANGKQIECFPEQVQFTDTKGDFKMSDLNKALANVKFGTRDRDYHGTQAHMFARLGRKI